MLKYQTVIAGRCNILIVDKIFLFVNCLWGKSAAAQDAFPHSQDEKKKGEIQYLGKTHQVVNQITEYARGHRIQGVGFRFPFQASCHERKLDSQVKKSTCYSRIYQAGKQLVVGVCQPASSESSIQLSGQLRQGLGQGGKTVRARAQHFLGERHLAK